MSVASYRKTYCGRDSFLLFCNDKIKFTFQERDQISRRDFGLSYRNFCLQRRLQMASVVDFIAHLSYVGIKAKLLDDQTYSTYVLCGVNWHQRSTATSVQVKVPHNENEKTGRPAKSEAYKNDQDLFIGLCDSIPLTPCDSGNRLTTSHFENCYGEFCRKEILMEASSEGIENHLGLLSVDTKGEVEEKDAVHNFSFNGANEKPNLCDNDRNGVQDMKCKPLRESNRRCKNKGKDSIALPESTLQAVSKRFRSTTVDAENASKLQSRSKRERKRNPRCSKSAKRIDECPSEMNKLNLNVVMSNFLHMTKLPQRWVSGVLLRDIRKYALYQLKMWLNEDGSEWILKLPYYEGIESFRQFVIENITLTGKMQDLILCDDFLKEYREFCVDRKLLQASDANINRSLSLFGINPHVKVLKPGQPRCAYSGLAWRHIKHYEKYEKIKVKVILHDRISVC